MALETGTFISDLVVTNPTGSDPLAFADDHLRLLKTTIKNTFPNVTGAVTKTHTEINTAVDQAAAALPKAGGTLTGPLVLAGAPTADLQAATKKYIDDAVASLSGVSAAYPVGSIYINATNATNPATLLGFGTWVAFGAGRVPVGIDASDPLFDAAEEVGGSKDAVVVSHTHTATTNTTGAHTHNSGLVTYSGTESSTVTAAGPFGTTTNIVTGSAGDHSHTVTVASTGSSGTNANLQPYITVYMWKRTA